MSRFCGFFGRKNHSVSGNCIFSSFPPKYNGVIVEKWNIGYQELSYTSFSQEKTCPCATEMYECFKAGFIPQTSANTWDPSEEHKYKWDPALSLSYQFTVTRRSWLPMGCLVLTGKCVVRLCWKEVMWWVWKIVLFLLLLVWPVKHSSCSDSSCSVWEAKQIYLVPSQGMQRLVVLGLTGQV